MKSDRDDYYYSIGGVHMGEEAASAIKREVSEETGLALKSLDRSAPQRLYGSIRQN